MVLKEYIDKNPEDRQQIAYNYLTNKGIKPHLAAGIIGNLMQESRKTLDSTAQNQIGAYGIAQWLGDRKTDLFSFAEERGTKPSNFQTQLDYLYKELTTVGNGWLSSDKRDNFFNAQTPEGS